MDDGDHHLRDVWPGVLEGVLPHIVESILQIRDSTRGELSTLCLPASTLPCDLRHCVGQSCRVIGVLPDVYRLLHSVVVSDHAHPDVRLVQPPPVDEILDKVPLVVDAAVVS